MKNIYTTGAFGRKTCASKDNPRGLSPVYDSISEAEVIESPSTPTIPDMAAFTRDASESYSALTERPAIFQQPAVYYSLDSVYSHVGVPPERATNDPLVYVNVAIG